MRCRSILSADKIGGEYSLPNAAGVWRGRGGAAAGDFFGLARSALAARPPRPGRIGKLVSRPGPARKNGGFPWVSGVASHGVGMPVSECAAYRIDLTAKKQHPRQIAQLSRSSARRGPIGRAVVGRGDRRGGGVPLSAARFCSHARRAAATGDFENRQAEAIDASSIDCDPPLAKIAKVQWSKSGSGETGTVARDALVASGAKIGRKAAGRGESAKARHHRSGVGKGATLCLGSRGVN